MILIDVQTVCPQIEICKSTALVRGPLDHPRPHLHIHFWPNWIIVIIPNECKQFFLSTQSKNWKDLLTDEPFTRKDIIVIQDPQNLDKFNISKFQHLKKEWKVSEDEKRGAKYFLKNSNAETEDILAELSKTYKGLWTDQ